MLNLIQAAQLVVDGYLESDLNYDKISVLIQAIETEKQKPEVICGWILEDMYSAAEMEGTKITDEQAEKLFELVSDNFDASVGMSWDVIQTLLRDNILEEKDEDEN